MKGQMAGPMPLPDPDSPPTGPKPQPPGPESTAHGKPVPTPPGHRAREVLACSYAGPSWDMVNEDGKDAFRAGAGETLAFMAGAGILVIDVHDEEAVNRTAKALHDSWFPDLPFDYGIGSRWHAKARAILSALAGDQR